MIKPVLVYPDARLKQPSLPVGEVTGETRALSQDLIDTMQMQGGIGISAPQIGVLKRVIIVVGKLSSSSPPVPWVMVDPVVKRNSGNEKSGEGCLSFPGVFEQVERSTEIEVEYTDLDGERRTVVAMGIEARCVLHEIDHLDGKLFIERMSPMRREMVRKALKRLTG